MAHSGGTGGAGLHGVGSSAIDSTENLGSAADLYSSSGFGPTGVSQRARKTEDAPVSVGRETLGLEATRAAYRASGRGSERTSANFGFDEMKERAAHETCVVPSTQVRSMLATQPLEEEKTRYSSA